MEWPALSPDLNPIEHMWDTLGREVNNRPHQPRTVQEMREVLLEEWDRITQYQVQRLIAFMRSHCTESVNNDGGHY